MPGRRNSFFRGCWPRREAKEPVLVKDVQVENKKKDSPAKLQSTDSQGHRMTARPRRRVAVAAENSEQLADARWKAAFDALRAAEQKSAEHTMLLEKMLSEHPIFSQMGSDVIGNIIVALRSQFVAKEESVIQQGAAGDAFYVLLEGEMKAFINGEEVATYSPGQSFGELALMYDAPRAATVKCTSNGALLYKLGRINFRKLVSNNMQKAKAGLESQLSTVPILAELGSDEIKQLAEAMEPVSFKDGEYIANIGDAADALYLILSGEVACHKNGETELRLAEGAVFGESALSAISNPKREANVVAVGAVKAMRLMASDCTAILGSIAKAIERSFCKKVINSIDIFGALSPEERSRLFSQLTLKKVEGGATIIEQGALGDTLYIIKSGHVDVVATKDGATKTVASLAGGHYFGERSLVKGEPTVSSVVATEPTELMCLSKDTFESLLGPMQKLIDRQIKQHDAELQAIKEPKIKMADLDVGKLLGEGSFGSVRIAIHKPTKTPYALKALHKGHLISTNQVKNTVNEKTIMKQCDHPFILACHGAFNQPKHVSLLLGLAQGGELFTRMSKVGTLKQSDTALYVAMVASALGFLSARKIAHRDLKLENLLFDGDGYLKLVDFGFAKVIEDRSWTFCGTPDYLAPEILSHKGHNYAVDWWTLGILTYEMLHGEPPFAEMDQMATFKRIASGQYRISSRVGRDAADMIQRLLVHNPAKRLGMLQGGGGDVLSHPLCADIDVAKLLRREIKAPWAPKLSDPTDTSNFDDFPEPTASKKFDKYLDAKYDELWDREFG